jgi:hypothetical protein
VGEQLCANVLPIQQFDRSVIDLADTAFDLSRPCGFDFGSGSRIKAFEHHAGKSRAIGFTHFYRFSNQFLQVSGYGA